MDRNVQEQQSGQTANLGASAATGDRGRNVGATQGGTSGSQPGGPSGAQSMPAPNVTAMSHNLRDTTSLPVQSIAPSDVDRRLQVLSKVLNELTTNELNALKFLLSPTPLSTRECEDIHDADKLLRCLLEKAHDRAQLETARLLIPCLFAIGNCAASRQLSASFGVPEDCEQLDCYR